MSRLERMLIREARELRPGAPTLDALDQLAKAADAEGLVDVAYAQTDSPLGPLTLAATEAGLVTLAYPDRTVDDVLAKLAERISPRILELPRRLDHVRGELDEYFAGTRTAFDFPIDWRLVADGFFGRILRAATDIEYGQTITYRQIAERAGNVKAVRAAGNGLGSNPIPIVVPCHRVVATGGGMGGYTGGVDRKQFLLALERGERELPASGG
jgi:methylated-DNA-[protein]-cysteine S-methyltransferase